MATKSGPPLLSYHHLMDGPHHISWNEIDAPKIEFGFGKSCDSSTRLEGDKEHGRLTTSSNINGRRSPFPVGNEASPRSETQEESDPSEETYMSISEYGYDSEEDLWSLADSESSWFEDGMDRKESDFRGVCLSRNLLSESLTDGPSVGDEEL